MGKKQILAAVLALILIFSLAGCGNSGKDSSTDNPSGGNVQTEKPTESKTPEASSDSTAEGEYKLTEAGGPDLGGVTLKIGLKPDKYITSYTDNEFTSMLQNNCNVKIEFFEFPSEDSDVQTKLSLMASSGGDMPDVIDVGLKPMNVLEYGSKGLFIPLNEYVGNDQLSPNLAKIPEEEKNVMLTAMTSADGNMYGLAGFSPETWNLTPYRTFINRAWLDKLSLKVPKTTEELTEVLRAFVNNDPNGNGKKDEIGVYGITAGSYGQNIVYALMSAFIFNNGITLQLDENDSSKVIAPWTKDAWREGLEYMRSLHEEGLLSNSVFVDDNTQYKATLNAETPIVGLVSAGSPTGEWPDTDNNPNFLQMECIEPFTGPKGISWTPYNAYSSSTIWYITSSCKYPEEAYRLGDYFYDSSIGLTNRYGKEEYHWTSDPEVCAQYTNLNVANGIVDKVTMVRKYKTDENVWNQNNNVTWHGVGPMYKPLSLNEGIANNPEDKKEGFTGDLPSQQPKVINAKVYANRHPEETIPALNYTIEEAQAIALPMTDITTYVETATAEFITGQRPLDDAGWKAYLDEMDGMGLQDWIDAAQTAYERTKK